MYKTMMRPAMLYGMEIIAITNGQEKEMEVAQMGCSGSHRKNADAQGKEWNCAKTLKVGELNGKVLRRGNDYVGQRTRQLVAGARGKGD